MPVRLCRDFCRLWCDILFLFCRFPVLASGTTVQSRHWNEEAVRWDKVLHLEKEGEGLAFRESSGGAFVRRVVLDVLV